LVITSYILCLFLLLFLLHPSSPSDTYLSREVSLVMMRRRKSEGEEKRTRRRGHHNGGEGDGQ